VTPRQFTRYIGIDYSGAARPESGLPGLRVYVAHEDNEPKKIHPEPTGKHHWSRQAVFNWLLQELAKPMATLVGIDHAFSFPLAYFQAHRVRLHWPDFLNDFCAHWPTDQAGVRVEDVRRGHIGNGRKRSGNARWKRLTEQGIGAKSVFHFDVPGSVAKSTHAGLPWLHALRSQATRAVHCWPFDGWHSRPGQSVLTEIYPSLWSANYLRGNRSPDEHDAYVVAAALQAYDQRGELAAAFSPPADPATRQQAHIEGWILGVATA